YSPAPGLAQLRDLIAAKLFKDNGLKYELSQIVVSNGAKQSLFNAILAICSEGDEIIVPEPYWLSYPEMVRVAGGKTVTVPTSLENAFKMTPGDLEKAVTSRTRALILNTPSNPTGSAYTKEELQGICEVCVARDIYIISDEIYEKIIYEGMIHTSAGSLSADVLAKTITVNGFSKSYAMTGWRLGYMAAPEEVAAACRGLQSHSTSGPNTFAQYGAIAALTGSQSCLDERLTAFTERRDTLYERLNGIEGMKCFKPMGAFYMFPDISGFGIGSIEFAERLLDREKVALIPGMPFGSDSNVRLSYACSLDTINEAMDRIERFVASL
ncbi:MAG: pyridoxal phosphate-dependent aminotransferase, partial [Verrucomicrobiota bacterium]